MSLNVLTIVNIESSGVIQYTKCSGVECETHVSPYDCSSIMHYRDDFFANGEGKTMTAKDPSTCDLSGYMTELTASDIELLKVVISLSFKGFINNCLENVLRWEW